MTSRKKKPLQIPDEPSPSRSELLLYTTPDQQTKVEVRLEDETVWLSQAQMAELFLTTKQNISLHIRNLYDEGELPRVGTVKESLTVRSEGGREVQRQIDLYNLDVIIAERADASKPNMGLTTWKGSPRGPIRKADTEIAKNYLDEQELKTLNLLVDQYLSFAELQAQQRKTMTMKDWARKLDDFLKLNDRDILTDAGRISRDLALEKAAKEFETYEAERRHREALDSSDFDRVVERIKKLPKPKKPAK